MYLYSHSYYIFLFIFMVDFSYLCFFTFKFMLHFFSFMYLYSHSCSIFIFIFMLYLSRSCVYIHIHVFIFTFTLYFHIHGYVMHGSVHSCSWFIFTARENLVHHFTFIFSPPKNILCFNNSRQCILVWSSCLDQPRVHLKFPDHVMPSITSTVSHNFALSHQQISWRRGGWGVGEGRGEQRRGLRTKALMRDLGTRLECLH